MLLHCVVRYQATDLVKLDILLNGQPVDAMATIVHSLKAPRLGRQLVEKLKQVIDRFVLVLIEFSIHYKISFAVWNYFPSLMDFNAFMMDRQMFEVSIQAAIGSKVVARET